MAHGGKRNGAGRKKGSTTKKTRDIAERVIAKIEISPLEVMLSAMRHAWKLAAPNGEDVEDEDQLKIAASFAEKAAPFIHPRLSSTKADVTGALTLENLVLLSVRA